MFHMPDYAQSLGLFEKVFFGGEDWMPSLICNVIYPLFYQLCELGARSQRSEANRQSPIARKCQEE